ncbi:MAG: hypothetical protein MJZ30_05890 [Paludibacteraceae bacterium]|nr:hypothetical protein [Paludibacteraceae bacterium]
MSKEEFIEASPWYDSEPKRIKRLAFDDGYEIGKQEVVDRAWQWMCQHIHLIGSKMELHSQFVKAMLKNKE